MGCSASTTSLAKQAINGKHGRTTLNGKGPSIYAVQGEDSQATQILTKKQKTLILKSWKMLSPKQVQHARTIFLRIFEQNPDLKALFPFSELEGEALTSNPLFQAHSLRFIQIIQTAIDSLDDLDRQIIPIILNLGKFHQRKATVFSVEYFQTFIDALLYIWSVELQSAFTVETEEAWSALMDFIVKYLKQGYNNQGPSDT